MMGNPSGVCVSCSGGGGGEITLRAWFGRWVVLCVEIPGRDFLAGGSDFLLS
jgi:hypothetical protein